MRHDWNILKAFYAAAISPNFIESLSEDKKLEAQTILSSIIVAMAEIKREVRSRPRQGVVGRFCAQYD